MASRRPKRQFTQNSRHKERLIMNKLVISECLKLYRTSRSLSIRECAKEIGISSATLSRIENGKDCDLVNFSKLLNWLMRHEVAANKCYVKRMPL